MMKKLLFILLAANVAVNSFAIEFSAQALGAINLLGGDTDPETDAVKMGGNETGRVRLESQMEIDNFGAAARLEAANAYTGIISAAGYIFYKPNKYMDFFITRKPENNGHWALDGNALNGFYGFARDVIVKDYHSYNGSITIPIPGFDNVFYSGFTDGAFFTFNAFNEDLKFHFGLPVFENGALSEKLQSLTFQISYKIGDFGLAGITYEGDVNERTIWDDSSTLYLYFNLSKFKKSNFDFGFGYGMPEKNGAGTEKRYYPLNFGFAASFDNEIFDFKIRLLMSSQGSIKFSDRTVNGPTDILTDILPSVSFTPNITGYLNAGMHLRILDEADPVFLWHINPYFVFGNMSTGAFYAGFRLDNRGGNNKFLYWSVPVGISFNF